MKLTSSAFQEKQAIPKRHTGDGADVSPPLQWADVPSTTGGFALVCDDPDAPRKVWVHWVLFDLPPGLRGLPEGVQAGERLPDGSKQGTNDFGDIGYGGPAPPRGKPHRYFFRLFALDAPVGLAAGATRSELERAMQGHVLDQCELMGTYVR